MSSPIELRYTESHEWARLEGQTATIGITAHAASSLSDLVYIDLPEAGEPVKQGETFGEIESVKAVADLKSPVTGEIIAVNDALPDDLSAIGKDPYGQGWMIKVKMSKTPTGLMDGRDYDKLMTENA